ncbi:MAG TPA: FeoC-like transcriptional regulator [Sphaerochaeta sp.]|nr:FeoC-like transcriptional regulator [Sphaerochaeta sp.]
MLKEILAQIYRDGYLAKAALARELDLSEEMIDEGIAQLLRMGYLKEEPSGVDCETTKCTGCAFAAMCGKNPVIFYQVTERGKALLA